MKSSNALITVILFLLTIQAAAQARPVVGAASAAVFGTVPKEIADRARVEAALNFRDELQIWLRQEMYIDIDTANTIKNFALNRLAGRCLKNAEEKAVTRGRVWTLSLSLSEEAVRAAIRAHNEHYDAQATAQFLAARVAGDDSNAALPAAVTALCAAMARIEPASASAAVSVTEARAVVQALFDKMRVAAPTTVIEGRQGSLPQKAPLAVITIDSVPLAGFHMTAFVQSGREFARVATDSRGEVPMANYKVPFVHNGSMLTISPDARQYIQADRFIRYRDLGVRFTKGQELTFIFKVPSLTYTLEYKAFTQEAEIKIPPEFSGDAHVRKYLKDVCGLVPAAGGKPADLAIKIGAQISAHRYNDMEEDGFRMAMRAEFRGAGIEKSHQEVFEKRQRAGLSFQAGGYFWEASGAIRELIVNTLAKD